MTFEERMNIISNNPKVMKAKEEVEREKQREIAENLALEIGKREDRIKAVIKLYNHCVECGVQLPKGDVSKYGYRYGSYGFRADGIRHHTGFMQDGCLSMPDVKTDYLGINNGGANGVWDFYTDGYSSFMRHEDNSVAGIHMRGDYTDACRDAFIYCAKKFLDEFDSFESAFYNFIDSLERG